MSAKKFLVQVVVPADAYSASGWNGNLELATKDAIRDELEGNRQPLNANLTSIAGLTLASSKIIYATGAGTAALLSVDGSTIEIATATLQVKDAGITLAKMANMATASFLGRNTAGTGVPEVLSVATVKTLLSLTGTNSGDQTITLTGNVTGSGTGSFATTIAAGVVTLSMLANMATASVFYRKTAGTGAPEVQTLATLKSDLGLTGTNSGDQTITLTGNVTGSGTGSFATTIAAGVVTLSMMANMATASILGRNTAGTGAPEVLSASTVKSILSVNNVDNTSDATKNSATATLSNKSFGDPIKLILPTSDNTASGPTTAAFNCGYSSSAVGDLVYLDSSATWQKCDANTLALYNGLLGIALEVKASGAALLVALPGSFVWASTVFPTFTIGSPIYMSETAGAITQTQPTTTDAAIRVIGWAYHADKIYFYPSPDYITHT